MCYLSTEGQYVCEINQGIAEAVTDVLGGAQFSSGPFYHPRSSRGRFGHPREAAVCAGNFPDSNGISDDFKRQKRSHHTEPVPRVESPLKSALPSLPSCGAASVHAAPLQSAGAQPNVALSLRSVPTRRSHERQCPPAAVPVQSRPAPPGLAGLQAALARGAAPVGGARVKSGFVFPIRNDFDYLL
jgi:hypothetical protein